MATVSLGDFKFEVDPSTFSWEYSLNTKSMATYGGRIVQILSCKLGNCTVQGYIPYAGTKRGGADAANAYAKMEEFEHEMLGIMDLQAKSKKPSKFSFPLLGWEGNVYVLQYGPVSYSYDAAAVQYTLQLSVDDGFEEVMKGITDEARASIDSIPSGVNWVRSTYNTPTSAGWEDALGVIKQILEDSGNYQAVGLRDYYEMLLEKTEGGGDENSESGTSTSLLGGAAVSASSAALSDIIARVLNDGITGIYGAIYGGGFSGGGTAGSGKPIGRSGA